VCCHTTGRTKYSMKDASTPNTTTSPPIRLTASGVRRTLAQTGRIVGVALFPVALLVGAATPAATASGLIDGELHVTLQQSLGLR